MEQEIWKSVKGYEGFYEVSNLGRVRTIARIAIGLSKLKNPRKTPVKAKIKKSRINQSGYVTVALVRNNVSAVTYLHRIIATAFISNPKGYKIINHKNGIKSDNRIENLEWCTSGYNNQHAINTRLRKPARAQIDEKMAYKIREMRSQKLTYEKIGELVGISKASIGAFLRGTNYKYLKI
jgi:hypothetical protein